MVLTDAEKLNVYPAATMECTFGSSANSMVNFENQFYKIDNTKIVAETSIPSWGTETVPNTKLYYNYNTLPPGNANYPAGAIPVETDGSNKLYKLNATTNKTGLEFVIKVMAGDKIDIMGKSYYLNTTNITNANSTALNLLELMTTFLTAPQNVAGGKGFTATTLNTTNTGVLPSSFFRGTNSEPTTTVPKAYINYIVFDEQFKYQSGGASRMGSSGTVKDHWNVDASLQNINIPKNGYIFVYVSNESNVDVFFDNLQVIHKPGPLVEETHYYPFGLTMAGISSKAAGGLENKRKWNKGSELASKEFSDGSGLELYETNFRSLDPQLGRFWQIDPMADAIYEQSPFAYANNNPLIFNDPLGLLSDSLHPELLSEVIIKSERKVSNSFLRYIQFPNQKPGTIASNKDWPLTFSKNRTNDLVDSWALGIGATNRIYLPNHPMTKRLKNAYQVNRARTYFYKKYLTRYNSGASMKGASVTDFRGNFGLSGLIFAGPDIVEQYVGSMDIDIQVDEEGENMLFIVSNNTSKTSALYHMTDSHERTLGNEAMGNMYQVYIWKESIKAGFSDYSTPRVSTASPTTGIPTVPFQ